MEGTVSAQVVVDGDKRLSGDRSETRLTLIWSPADPLAVEISLEVTPAHPAFPQGEWVVLRDFLRYGCTEPSGDGRVRFRPQGDGRVQLELEAGRRHHVVSVDSEILLAFLDHTATIVPEGREAGDEVLDDLVRLLLDR